MTNALLGILIAFEALQILVAGVSAVKFCLELAASNKQLNDISASASEIAASARDIFTIVDDRP